MRAARRASITAIVALLALAAANAAPAGAAIPAGNLLANPGAEDGPGATNSTDTFAPPGWTNYGYPMTAVAYGTAGFPTAADSASYGGGANFFAGGNDTDNFGISYTEQYVDVSGAAPEIDAGGVQAELSARLGGFSSQEDNMTAAAIFLDGSGAGLDALIVGPVTAQERNFTTGLLPRSSAGAVPPNTRTIWVYLYAARDEGTYNDGYADNVSLSLSATAPPETGETGTASVVSGTVLVCEKGSSRCRELTGDESIPVGSIVDATAGRVQLTTETRGGGTQTTDFYDGRFKFDQSGSGLVTATLEGTDFGQCRSREDRRGRKLARLWGDGKGKSRTKGRRGSGTVRGTVWVTEERCKGTFFRVEEGSLKVRDFARKRNVTVRAGDSYLARSR